VPVELDRLRTEVLKAKWDMDKNNATITLTALAPPTHPHVALIYNGLLNVWLEMRDTPVRQHVRDALHATPRDTNGPVARLQQVADQAPELAPLVCKLVDIVDVDVQRWAHDLREVRRRRQWSTLAVSPPSFAGVEHWVERERKHKQRIPP
jgi:hypothetical protein